MGDRDYSPRRHGDYSDDEYPTHREKFRRERSIERDRDRVDDYGRSKKRRSVSPSERDSRHNKRTRGISSSPPSRRRDSLRDSGGTGPEGDHYIPNYERDGYLPGPRYGDMPESNTVTHFNFPVMNESSFFPPEFMNSPMMSGPFFPGSSGRVPAMDPNQLDYLVTFRHFTEHYAFTHSSSRLSDEEMQRKYGRYKEEFAARQLSSFFEKNKSHEWFMEKYHPKMRAPRLFEALEIRRGLSQTFIKELEEGKWDDVLFDEKKDESGQKKQVVDDDENIDDGKEEGEVERKKDELQTWKLIIKTVPPSISRQKIIDMCKEVDGFQSVVLSEPSPNKKFHRIGWITFKEGTDMQVAFDKLDNKKIDDFVFHMAMHKNQPPSRTRAAPEIANTPPRLKLDLNRIKQVVSTCDAELGHDCASGELVRQRADSLIEAHRAEVKSETNMDEDRDVGELTDESNDDLWEIKKRLDMFMVYLRKVHMFCYYCGGESDSVEELQRKCSDFHVRKTDPYVDDSAARSNKMDKSYTWAKNLDQKIDIKIKKLEEIDMEKLGGKDTEKEIRRFLKSKVIREHDAKFKCGVDECRKAFKGPEFVEKHIRTKHLEIVDRLREDLEFFNNYVRDPNHLLPTTPPNPSATMNPPTSTTNLNITFGATPSPAIFPPMTNIPPGFPFVAAPEGTPLDQIPRIGFNMSPAYDRSGVRKERDRGRGKDKSRAGTSRDDDLLIDPRAQRGGVSYVDLDDPAKGDVVW